jgi:hypothetical protein
VIDRNVFLIDVVEFTFIFYLLLSLCNFFYFQFATDRNVFLFDVLELSAECFEDGIKNILENPDVLKVS